MNGTAVAVGVGIALRQDAVKSPAATGSRTWPCVAVHRLARAWRSWAAWPPRSIAANAPPLQPAGRSGRRRPREHRRGVGQQAPAGRVGEDLLQGAREAFAMGLQAVAGLNIVVRVAMAALAVALLRRLPPIGQSEPDSALAAAAAADQHPKPAPRAHRSLVSSPIQP